MKINLLALVVVLSLSASAQDMSTVTNSFVTNTAAYTDYGLQWKQTWALNKMVEDGVTATTETNVNATITASQFLDFTNRLQLIEAALGPLTNGADLSVSSPLPVVGMQGRHIVTIPVHRGSANTVGTAAAPPIEIAGVAISATNSAMISGVTLISGDTITNNVKLLFSLYPYPEWPGTNQAVNLASTSIATNPFVSITTSNTAAGHWEKFGSNVFWTMDAGYRCLPVNASNALVLSVVKDGEEIQATNDMVLVIDTLKD